MKTFELTEDIQNILKKVEGQVMRDKSMSELTWFRVGGQAKVLFQPADEQDLIRFLRQVPKKIPIFTLGLGSNILVREGGPCGIVIRLSGKGFGSITAEDNYRVRVGTAVPDRRLAAEMAKLGIGGFEFFAGIPGSIGGAIRMNAGAHGTETKDRVIEVRAINREGEVLSLSNKELGFSYRQSKVPGDLIFTSVLMEGYQADPTSIHHEMESVIEYREEKQPIRTKTSGSTFKNPSGYSAWKLIDKAGCRGMQCGAAKVSEMHCNFLENTGTASATELEQLGEMVRERVFAESGILLEWEIKRIGKFVGGKEVAEFSGTIE